MGIFGTDRSELNTLGIVWPSVCPQCRNKVWFSGIEAIYRAYILFIPTVQRGRRHYLVCPICNYNIQITQDEYIYAKDMNEYGVKYDRGRLNAEDYQEILEKFDRDTDTTLPKPLQPASAKKAKQNDDIHPKGIQ